VFEIHGIGQTASSLERYFVLYNLTKLKQIHKTCPKQIHTPDVGGRFGSFATGLWK